jgi:hypothetical protein
MWAQPDTTAFVHGTKQFHEFQSSRNPRLNTNEEFTIPSNKKSDTLNYRFVFSRVNWLTSKISYN